ncbi:hypothetical protein SE18_24625 [Herpetosiphon geysericola]|uniref:Uncharacterized protein n=1 Tax=Herpetosiphon geysericola TaxID=70996 RepID=A0A0P6XCL0_9CHLR|nr:hypothetical protein SE18_24625 [Herpetosiphon geysericola]
MGSIGNGAKAAAATAPAATVEPSTSSAPSAKRPTKRTNASARQLKPVTQTEALEMLRSALAYLQLSGVQAHYRMSKAGLLLQLDGVYLDGVRFAVRDVVKAANDA